MDSSKHCVLELAPGDVVTLRRGDVAAIQIRSSFFVRLRLDVEYLCIDSDSAFSYEQS